MTSRLISSRNVLIALGVTLMTSFAAIAQDNALTFAPSKLIVTAADGAVSEYMVNDLNVYLSHNAGYDDIPPSTDFSLSLSILSPIDTELLEWAAQGASEDTAMRAIEIVANAQDGAASDIQVRYVIDGAKITSLSTSHSTYAVSAIALSLAADELTIDGVKMK